MPTAVVELPARVDPPRKRWTRAECDVLCSSGIVDCQRLELIEGDVIVKERHDPPHMYVASMLYQWAWAAFGGDVVIPYAPINVAPEDNRFNAPEPDLIVLDRNVLEIPADEIADTIVLQTVVGGRIVYQAEQL